MVGDFGKAARGEQGCVRIEQTAVHFGVGGQAGAEYPFGPERAQYVACGV